MADAELIKLMVAFPGVQRDKGSQIQVNGRGIRTRREADFPQFTEYNVRFYRSLELESYVQVICYLSGPIIRRLYYLVVQPIERLAFRP